MDTNKKTPGRAWVALRDVVGSICLGFRFPDYTTSAAISQFPMFTLYSRSLPFYDKKAQLRLADYNKADVVKHDGSLNAPKNGGVGNTVVSSLVK